MSKNKRAFSKKEKLYLLLLSNNKCNICGKEINDLNEFHADHIIPYSKGGKTELKNGQVLCPKCNLTKGNKMSEKEPRSWQVDAYEKLVAEWKLNNSKPLIASWPGTGKTFFSVYAAKKLLSESEIEYVLVVSPTDGIKSEWKITFNEEGLNALISVDNNTLKPRVLNNRNDPLEGKKVLIITYQQLSSDSALFEELVRRHKTLIIADEVHHADDSKAYGIALDKVASIAEYRLALSGTPFNTKGGSLAMCNCEVIEEDGESKMRTIPTFTYTYSEAIKNKECRPIEFYKEDGECETSLRNIETNEIEERTLNLKTCNEDDSLIGFINPDSDFFHKMTTRSLDSLYDFKHTDSKAAMLVVAKEIKDGRKITKLLKSMCKKNHKWCDFNIDEVYSDSENANKKIKAYPNNNVDIIVTVRMIAEGINIKRLKVGLYATNYLTEMFFIQFCGRFLRWEDHLKDTQHAKIIMPNHPKLFKMAENIENMCLEAKIQGEDPGPGGGGPSKYEFINSEAKSNGHDYLYRGKLENEIDLAEAFFNEMPDLKGLISNSIAIKIAKKMKQKNGENVFQNKDTSNFDDIEDDDEIELYSNKNQKMISKIHFLLKNTKYEMDYPLISSKANSAVGIKSFSKKITPLKKSKERYNWLKEYFEIMSTKVSSIKTPEDFFA